MKTSATTVYLCSLLALVCSVPPVGAAEPGPQDADFFESKVRPILAQNCFSCHGPKKQQAGLRLDSRAAVLKGSDNCFVMTPGDTEKSALIKAIRYADEPQMPPKGKLPAEAIDVLTAWVKKGAPWPESKTATVGQSGNEAGKDHWAFRPVRDPPLPTTMNPTWA